MGLYGPSVALVRANVKVDKATVQSLLDHLREKQKSSDIGAVCSRALHLLPSALRSSHAFKTRVNAVICDTRGLSFDAYWSQRMCAYSAELAKGGQRYERIKNALSQIRVTNDVVAAQEDIFESEDTINRSIEQVNAHNIMMNSLLHHIYGLRVYKENAEAIGRLHNVTDLIYYLIIKAPRRNGKTVLTAMIMSTLIVYLESPFVITVFGQGARAAHTTLKLIYAFASQLAPGRVFQEGERVFFASSGDRHQAIVNEVIGLPGSDRSVNNLRGQGGHIVYVEEGSFVGPLLWKIMVGPMTSRAGTALIIVTSAATSDTDFISRLQHAKSKTTGKNLFYTYTIDRLCHDCREAGSLFCSHTVSRAPQWIQQGNMEVPALLCGDDETRIQLANMASATENYCFDRAQVSHSFPLSPDLWVLDTQVPDFIFFSVDPSGGTDNSNTSVVAGYYTLDNRFVVSNCFFPFLFSLSSKKKKIRRLLLYSSVCFVLFASCSSSVESSNSRALGEEEEEGDGDGRRSISGGGASAPIGMKHGSSFLSNGSTQTGNDTSPCRRL